MSSRLVCDYSLHLVWEEDAFSSGKCHGRAGVWSKASTSAINEGASGDSVASSYRPIVSQQEVGAILFRRHRTMLHQPKAFLNTNIEDMRLYYQITRRELSLYQGRSSDELSIFHLSRPRTPSAGVSGHNFHLSYLGDPQPQLPLFPSSLAIPEDQRILIDYYKNVVCLDITHIRRDEEHDPRQFFLWQATESRAVYLGVLMSSATFLERQDSRYVVIALQYRQRVLKILSALLKMRDTRATEMIMLAMMLCSSEVSIVI